MNENPLGTHLLRIFYVSFDITRFVDVILAFSLKDIDDCIFCDEFLK